MVTRELWRNRATGELWAVELRDGVVAAGAGPLRLDDAHVEYLNGLDYSTDVAARLERERDSFVPFEPRVGVDPA